MKIVLPISKRLYLACSGGIDSSEKSRLKSALFLYSNFFT